MPELLLELFSEEIPARMQARAGEDLRKLVTDALVEQGLVYESAYSFVTARRLTLCLEGVPAEQKDIREERKGPRIDAPEKAIEGFLRSAGVSRDECREVEDKKGTFLVAVIEKKGRRASDIIAEIVEDVIRKFPWPKSMRWGSGSLRWVRPLHSILCILDGVIVPLDVDGLKSADVTYGHRFMGDKAPIKVTGFEDYAAGLKKAKVILDAAERAEIIANDAQNLAFAQNLELIEDHALLNETAGLVEWPVVLMGTFDEAFLDLPPEVIITSIKSHQKCFALTQKNGQLANKYILVSNLIAKDGGEMIVKGNNKVIAARLSDAKFFWELDKKTPLSSRVDALKKITFHARLGTQAERVEKIIKLAVDVAGMIGADAQKVKQAAELCKADLVTEMVGEFPELQGLMGQYYAQAEGLDNDVATAICDHYKPQGPSDNIPASKTGQTIALADKLIMLKGFWSIDEKPTGSKDPFALRRAALGIIRILVEQNHSLSLRALLHELEDEAKDDLLSFFAERLKVYLRDKGARHDLIDAVFALGDQDDLVMIVKRVEALGEFLETDDGTNLLQGFKRAANILAAEEKKKTEIASSVDTSLFEVDEERALFNSLEEVEQQTAQFVGAFDFTGAMSWLARLRQPVDAFFEAVHVNADDDSVRANRLALLARIRSATRTVADFGKISS